MAYRRNIRQTRRPTLRRRTWKRRSGRLVSRTLQTRLPRGMNSGVHHFKRVFQLGSVNIAGTTILNALSFKFDDIGASKSDFTTLFDQYRMNGIRIEFVPNFTGGDLNPTTSAVSLPNFHSCIDHDDDVAPADLATIMQYPSYRRTRGARTHVRYFKPSVLYDVGGVASLGLKYGAWVNMGNTDIKFYGLKYCIDQFNTTPVGTYRIYCTYYFSCKGVR